MESFDNENEDKRTQQVLSSEVQGKVVEAFEVFDHENNKTVDVREVIGEMEDPEQMGYIHLDRFLPVMSRIILQEKFLPAAHEDLLAAFQALDVDNTGHIDKEILTQIFTEEGEAFSEEEMQEFCNAALDPVTKSVHYKEFVHFLSVDDNF